MDHSLMNTMPPSNEAELWLDVIVRSVRNDAAGVLILELERPCGTSLPPFEPGAHVAIKCGPDLVRHYSLCGSTTNSTFYRLGIKIEPRSRGGTKWIQENVRPRGILSISSPRNNFPLVHDKSSYLFISAGIGITPILPMLDTLRYQKKRARLVHLCRTPGELSFSESLRDLAVFHDVHVHFDSVTGGLYDIVSELRRTATDTAVYCCGPMPLMNVVRDYSQRYGRAENFYFEFFQGETETAGADATPFVIVLNSTGQEIPVRSNETILLALRSAGIPIESECEEGVCGTCALRVVSGVPDHRDSYLTAAERSDSRTVLSCVSRSRSARLVVDM
jgi:ferredoxin-NADP reductase